MVGVAALSKGIASLPKAMNVLKTRFVGAKNLDKLKLTDDSQVFDVNYHGHGMTRKAHIPPKTFPKIFEKAATGEISQTGAAEELGPIFTEIRSGRQLSGAPRTGVKSTRNFNQLFDAYLENRPDDLFTEGGKFRVFKAGFNNRTMSPTTIKQVNDLLETADKGSKKIPFNIRFYKAFLKSLGPTQLPPTRLEKWSQAKDLGAQIKAFKGQPPEDFNLPKTLRFDKKGNIVDVANPFAGKPKKMFDETPVGEILKGPARFEGFKRMDTGGKWMTVADQIRRSPVVNRYLEPIKNAAPKDSRGIPITSRYYQIDHKVPLRFGGTNDKSNLRFIVQGQHTGPQLEKGMTSVDDVVKAKSSFEDDVFRKTINMIDAVIDGDFAAADKLKKDIFTMQNNFKITNPKVDFGIGEPYVLVKTKDSAERVKYVDYKKVSSKIKKDLKKYLKTYSNSPNKNKSIEDSAREIWERYMPFINMYGGKLPKRLGHDLGEFNDGGLINSDLTDTIPPTGGPMSEGIPLLDPQESIDKANRQRFAAGGAASAFTNLFSKLSKVPRAVGRFGDIKKPTLAKPKLEGEIAISQAPEDKPAMFLSTVNAIEETPDAAKMNAQQWLGTIKNKKGVSEVELDEFGLEPLLNNIAKNNPKRIITKPELVEMYGREMPKIDMTLSLAEPVSRGAKDLASMLLNVRKSRHGAIPKQLEDVNILSDDARLIGALHQAPQDRVGFIIRNNLVDIMKGTNVEGDNLITGGGRGYGSMDWDMNTGNKFAPMWKQAFPKMYDKVNDIVKEGHKDVLSTLVPAEDVTRLSQAKNISQEEAFEQLYQALNIFDRRVINRDVPIPFYTKKLLYRMGDMAEGRGFTYKSIGRPGHEGVNQDLPGRAGYGELKFYFNFDEGAARSKELKYQSGHFESDRIAGAGGESNAPFGWARFSERIDESGRKILLIEETQSDLHQSIMKGNFKYADRLDKSGVLMEMGDLSKQLSLKIDTLASTRLRKDNILALPRAERELPANKAELKNAEDAIKKLIKDKKDLEKKIEAAEAATGRSGSVYPEAPFKKSENYAKMFIQGVLKMAHDKGYDGVAVSTGRMKKHYGSIPKGGDKFYDEIAVKAMKKISKKSGFRFSDTTLTDGAGYTWERIPIIELKDKVTGEPIPGTSVLSAYKKGGIVNQNMVRGYNGY